MMIQPWPVVIVGVIATLQWAKVILELVTALTGLATALLGLYHTYRRLTRSESQ